MDEMNVDISTTGGIVRGTSSAGISSFLGIPFAAAPIGSLRFQPPQPVKPWKGVREVKEFSASPAQPASHLFNGKSSEDCLYLNVWAPASSGFSRPVIVWIYGGGFQGGTASTDAFSGEHFVNRGNVVVVSLNYRVGLLGFSALPDSETYPSSTNLGVRDVIAGLDWVQNNIANFGGDPTNVTVMGHSAGAFIAAALLASHKSQGLFTKLVLLSGGASRIVPDHRASAITEAAIDFLGGDPSDFIDAEIELLFEAQGQVLATDIGVRNSTEPNALGVVLDSSRTHGLLSAHPMDVILSGEQVKTSLLIGVTEAEISSFRKWSKDEEFAPSSLEALAEEVTSWGVKESRAKEIVNGYRKVQGESDTSLARTRELLLTDWIYRLPAARLAQNHSVAGGSSWLLEFRGTSENRLGHGDEIAPLFDNFAVEQGVEVDEKYKNEFQDAILAFAHKGDPGWPRYSVERGETKILGSDSYLENKTFEDLLQCWGGIERP